MSIDRNGRSHKPKGLPQHEAGTYERAHTAMRDDDLQADPTPTPERVRLPGQTAHASHRPDIDAHNPHPVRVDTDPDGQRPPTFATPTGEHVSIEPDTPPPDGMPADMHTPPSDRRTRVAPTNSDDPWAVDPRTPIDPDMFDTQPAARKPGRRTRHATVIPEDAPTWDGPDITIRMIAEYAPIHIDPDDIQPDTIGIDREHASVVILDRGDNLKHHRITMPTPDGLRAGDRLAWDGQHWRILKRGPQPRPAREPREQPTADGRAAVASRPTSGRRTPTRPADQHRTRRAADHDPNTIRRRRLANATLILLRGLAAAIRRGLRGR